MGIRFVNKGGINTQDYQECEAIADDILGEATLPYQELQYITFTGTQYLNTLYPLWSSDNKDWGIEMKIQLSSLYNYQHLLSVSETDTNNETWVGSTGVLSTRVGTTAKTDVMTLSANRDYVIMHTNAPATQFRTYVDGVQRSITSATSSYTNNNIRFGHRDSGIFKGRLYYLKMYSGGVLVRNLIPVKIISSGVVCYYDKVSREYFFNAGTGNFIEGSVK